MDKVRFLLLVIAALSPPAFAAGDPFVGAWKLDAARSHLVAETMRYTDLGEGRMHFSNGATLDYDFALDGNAHPTVDGRTMAWTPAGPGRWDTVLKVARKVTERASRTLSADGRELVVIADGELPDGTRYRHAKHYARVGGGSGLAGTWRNEQVDTNGMPDGYVISKDASGMITWEIPTDKQVLRGRFDGTEMVLTGPNRTGEDGARGEPDLQPRDRLCDEDQRQARPVRNRRHFRRRQHVHRTIVAAGQGTRGIHRRIGPPSLPRVWRRLGKRSRVAVSAAMMTSGRCAYFAASRRIECKRAANDESSIPVRPEARVMERECKLHETPVRSTAFQPRAAKENAEPSTQ